MDDTCVLTASTRTGSGFNRRTSSRHRRFWWWQRQTTRTSLHRPEHSSYPYDSQSQDPATPTTSSTSPSGNRRTRTAEDRLLQNLKLAILNIQQEITDQDDFNHFLTEALKDVADKNQPLPYFASANPPYRLDLLPTERRSDKFFREEFNQLDTSRNYGLVEYLNDPPFYDMTTYTYEAGATQIMTQKDFCRFLGLTYLRLRLVEDYAEGRLRSATKRSASAMET